MEYTLIIILIALLQFIVFTAKTGFTRNKYSVNAPKTTGHDEWERIYRIQQNTMEQLIIFIPAMYTFTLYVSERWVILPGVLFVIGRQVYSYLYAKDPATRGPGVALSFFSNIALVVGSLIGIILSQMG